MATDTAQHLRRLLIALEPVLQQLKVNVEELLVARGISKVVQQEGFRYDTEIDSRQTNGEPKSRAELCAELGFEWHPMIGAAPRHPFARWHDDVLRGRLPPEWEQAGIELPPVEDRPVQLAALEFASRIQTVVENFEREASGDDLTVETFYEITRALQGALWIIAFTDFDYMLRGFHRQWTNRRNALAGRPHSESFRRAGVALCRKIMKGQSVLTLPDILKWVGTSYYPAIELDGNHYSFKTSDGVITVCLVQDGSPVHCQEYRTSTLYKWRSAALKLLC